MVFFRYSKVAPNEIRSIAFDIIYGKWIKNMIYEEGLFTYNMKHTMHEQLLKIPFAASCNVILPQ